MNDKLEMMLDNVILAHVKVRTQHFLVTPKETIKKNLDENYSSNFERRTSELQSCCRTMAIQ